MTEYHNYCDALTGECLQAKRITELEAENAQLREALQQNVLSATNHTKFSSPAPIEKYFSEESDL